MPYRYLLLTLLAVTSMVWADTLRLSEPVASTPTSETFGALPDTSLPEVSMATLFEESERYTHTPFRLTTRVAKVCQKKGCFFIAQSGESMMRVSFRDYGFFIPTDSSAKTVTLAGQLTKRTMTPEQAAHYRQDLGEPDSNLQAGVVYEIVADSVTIMNE
ncbi:DUF4920 domain-containing protein [Alteromonas halophila]|uniref:DUF4920 domain-containing protein n=1 Tax=Alteromonas halophila TaxID=516698 RepID=A0A918JK46_9ALTE|nr:DUF4920 domain-containing protein [Alteromonas halophila]GGW84308.1 hypothetical protein GCM10007391_17530 [Alteromonas halophila]